MSFLNPEPKPTEEEVIMGSDIDTLYTSNFNAGKYFQVVVQDESGFEIQIAPRTMFKVLYIKNKNDIVSFEIIKLTKKSNGADFENKQKVTLSKFSFSQLVSFLKFVSILDLKGITERKISLKNSELENLDENTKKKIRTLLQKDDGKELLEELIKNGLITSKDLVNTGFRKHQLEIFKKLLCENYLHTYKKEIIKIENIKDELAWQYFFNKNTWIFGYGLDYKFQGILQKEFHASNGEADGSNGVISDFLIGDKRFTTFVELKKPNTKIFGKEKNRSNSWRLSNDLIDAVSQILEQKASGQVKLEINTLHDDRGSEIKQNAYDSKVVLIIGNWDELKEVQNDLEKQIKEKTFELFRRDSRNIEIITYDELYERAKFIVEEK